MFNSEQLQEKWQPVLNHPDLPQITDSYKRAVTAVILENQEKELKESRQFLSCLLYTSPSPRDRTRSRMPSSA